MVKETYTFHDGGKYVGEFKDGIRGNGTSYDINGESQSSVCEWKKNNTLTLSKTNQ